MRIVLSLKGHGSGVEGADPVKETVPKSSQFINNWNTRQTKLICTKLSENNNAKPCNRKSRGENLERAEVTVISKYFNNIYYQIN